MTSASQTSAPSFLVTVDTEGDNLWAKPRMVTTRNAAFIPRFQALCEAHGLKPTYLTNWEMAVCPAFVEFGRELLGRDAGEIGMHLHAWNSPPAAPLTSDDDANAPFLIEYPPSVMREKIHAMTARLEETFQRKMKSHRAGRWSFNETYARMLVEEGYEVDCSVTPNVSWRFCKGDPKQNGGSDFSDFPESAYFLDLNNIRRPGNSPLLELPMTVLRTRTYPRPIEALRKHVDGRYYPTLVLRKLFPYQRWLMPNGRNRGDMLKIIQAAREQRRPYVELAIHSSELMAAGSPNFPDERSIEELYESLGAVFEAAKGFAGRTLTDYRREFAVSNS